MAFLRLSRTMVVAVAALAMLMAVRGTLGDGECNTTLLCPPGDCCSTAGFCGTGHYYCDPENCASQCPVRNIINSEEFGHMLPRRNTNDCHAVHFYTYSAFIEAAESFPEFGTIGDNDTVKRELAAFFGQTSHETDGYRPGPLEPYTWGYCYKEAINKSDNCVASEECPCEPGKQYYGRGPIMLSWNYNYCQCGKDLGMGLSLLKNPEQVSEKALIAFKAAIWFWMTPQDPKPSCHEVMIGTWVPDPVDEDANRLPGFGLTTNIINGGLECGKGENAQQENRIGYYKRYCDILGVSYGDNLDCNSQDPYVPAMNLRSGGSPAVSEALVA